MKNLNMLRSSRLLCLTLSILTTCTLPAFSKETEKDRQDRDRKEWRKGALYQLDQDFKQLLSETALQPAALMELRTRLLAQIKARAYDAPVSALRVAEIQANLLALGEASPEESLLLCQQMTDYAVAQAGNGSALRERVARFWSSGWILPRDAARVAAALAGLPLPSKGSEGVYGLECAWAAWYFPHVDEKTRPLFSGAKFTASSAYQDRLRDFRVADSSPGLFPFPYLTLDHILKEAATGKLESLPRYEALIKQGKLPEVSYLKDEHIPMLTTVFQLGLTPPLTRDKDGVYSLPASPGLIGTLDSENSGSRYGQNVRAYLAALTKAEKQGNARAMFLLGILEEEGKHEPYLMRQSRPALASPTGRLGRAAELGEPNALSVLGEWLYVGNGVPHDVPRAIRMWSQAARLGDPRSKALLDACIEKNLPGSELALELRHENQSAKPQN
ncbi:MAG: hypothetical protein ABI273_20555 [Lacunisphaera sp.]